jgi:hypothetical protein
MLFICEGRDELHVMNEESVFLAVMRWIKHEPTERAALLPSLLVKVEFSSIRIKEIE